MRGDPDIFKKVERDYAMIRYQTAAHIARTSTSDASFCSTCYSTGDDLAFERTEDDQSEFN